MKGWWARVVKDYFTFSKKDRSAIFLLLVILLLIYLTPYFLKPKKEPINHDAFAKELSELKISVDSSRPHRNYRNDEEFDYYRPQSYAFEKAPKGELFEFDPNTLNAEGWKRLGVRDKTINTIQNFLSKGYKFRQPADIKKIYGLRPAEAERLIPFIRIEERATPFASSAPPGGKPFSETRPAARSRVVDINAGDTTDLIALPGIGSKLAARIISFRDKLGGFASVEQVAQTYGVPDSTFQKIKPFLRCNPATIKRFDVNTADVNDLKGHPYIRWNIANAIVNYRKQHGNYNSVDDLKKINIITEDVFNKIAPYLKVL